VAREASEVPNLGSILGCVVKDLNVRKLYDSQNVTGTAAQNPLFDCKF
jgi:hypothetical protein